MCNLLKILVIVGLGYVSMSEIAFSQTKMPTVELNARPPFHQLNWPL